MAGHHRLRRNDQVCIYFKTEEAAPYKLHGKYLGEDDEQVRIEGTVGDMIGHDLFIPKSEIKLIERIAQREYDEA